MDYLTIRKLVDDYNRNPDKYNDMEAETIALLSRETGQRFKRQSKPIRKALYQAGEMASFGLLPDSWEPRSRGQDVFGQTTIDKIASGVGMGAGLVGGLGAAAKGAKGAYGMTKGMLSGGSKDALRKVRQKMSQAGVNIKGKVGDVAGVVGASAVGRIGSNLGQAGKLYAQGGMNVARLQGMKAAQALANRTGIPYETAVKVLQYGGGGAAAIGVGSQLPIFEEDTPSNPFSSYYNYPKLYGNAPVEERYFSDPRRDKKIPGAMY
tara:strand:+ start:8267 stop:9061 length:795 start_codon:yes stop_codon:yes gene_type:complete